MVEGMHQIEHKQITPKPGWVEHNPMDIYSNTVECIKEIVEKGSKAGISKSEIKGIGITNQRESTVAWRRSTGLPLHNSIVWLDTRTKSIVDNIVDNVGGPDAFRHITGLPISTYFSGLKMRWLLDNLPEVQKAANEGDLCLGTIDSWLLFKLTGGNCFKTDITNASRTMLMNLAGGDWDQNMLTHLAIPHSALPQIRSSSEIFDHAVIDPIEGIPISGVIGDQQSACLGHLLAKGEAKCTFGTGCFLLLNTGDDIIESKHGMLSTTCFKLGNKKTQYALEGSVEMGGACISWAKNNLGLFTSYDELNELISSVEDSGDVCFIPSFSGLFAPHWRADSRGLIMGLTQYTTKAHILRAIVEGISYRNSEALESMRADSQLQLKTLKVDGGLTANPLLMQIQSDFINTQVQTKQIQEITALGAAIAAGVADGVGVWSGIEELGDCIKVGNTFAPLKGEEEINLLKKRYKQALQRSLDWAI